MRKLALGIQAAVILMAAGIFLLYRPTQTAAVLIAVLGMAVVTCIGFVTAGASERRLHAQVVRLSREMSVAVSRVASVSQDIGITIGESNERSEDLFHQAHAMTALNADAGGELESMIAQIKNMISSSTQTRDLTLALERTGQLSFDSTKSAIGAILGIVDTMAEIRQASGQTESSLGQLQAASENARAILGKISSISQQMRLISVNASVEAARAGQYGSGFAVIAGEFHALSSLTDTALKEIGALLGDIQEDIGRVGRDVHENSRRIEAGVLSSKGVEGSLQSILSSYSDLLAAASRISAISDVQSRLADEMGGRLNAVESLLGRTDEAVQGVYDSALCQRQDLDNISDLGRRLAEASDELNAVADSSAEQVNEPLDDKTREACLEFFPVLERGLATNPVISGGSSEAHNKLLNEFMKSRALVEAAWTNLPNGRFICSIPPSGIANAGMRDWFRAAVNGEKYISPIYISGITKNRCVTLSMPYRDKSGGILGVVGIDLNLGKLQKSN